MEITEEDNEQRNAVVDSEHGERISNRLQNVNQSKKKTKCYELATIVDGKGREGGAMSDVPISCPISSRKSRNRGLHLGCMIPS